MNYLLAGLRAAGEATRLRLLTLSAHAELSVTELTQILGQSQPRVSRHLKLLVEAELLERFREGATVFYRIASHGKSSLFAKTLVDLLPTNDNEFNRDLLRLEQVLDQRRELAESYFNQNAKQWNNIRKLHVPEAEVEQQLLKIIGSDEIESFIDIGTGTGRILSLLANHVRHGVGIDQSPEMLTVARAYLEQKKISHLRVRKADMYNLPWNDQSVDLATVHLVLHYSEDPASVIQEAARILKPKGRLIIVDFATHQEEHLRVEHKHIKLGFSDKEMKGAMKNAGLNPGKTHALPGYPLTVNIWQGARRNLH